MVASPSLVTLLIWSGKPPEQKKSCIHEFGKNIFIGFHKRIFSDFFAGTTLKEDLAVWELV